MPPFDHSCPALLGPGDRYFTMDHHRLGRTLLDEEVDSVFVRMERSVALTGVVFRRATTRPRSAEIPRGARTDAIRDGFSNIA